MDLERGEIGNEGAQQLAEALKTNEVVQQLLRLDILLNIFQTLREVNIQRNKLDPEDIRYLAEALKINKVRKYDYH